MISVVFPAYNEEENIAELHRRLVSALKETGEEFEIIGVDNASNDTTLNELKKLSPIRIISLDINMGQTAALDAGIHAARGEVIVILDADLQNDPADIPQMFRKLQEGYDVVTGWRKIRNDSFGRRIFSSFANSVTRKIAGLKIHDYGCALRMFKKRFLEGVHLYGVMHVFIPVIMAGRGARVTEVVVRHHERQAGVSKYTFVHMATDIADLLTIKFLYVYAARPLVFFGTFAIGSFVLAVIALVVSFTLKFEMGIALSQTPLPVFSALFIILGFLLCMLGFIVEILIRIYYEARGVTPYKIRETIDRP